VARLATAATEMTDAGLLGEVKFTLVEGPDDYLLGEEKGLLESIEGNEPLPRLYPPYIRGLYADQAFSNPAVVDNVETLCNIPHIMREGSAWYRSIGTEQSPGTMVFSISGDVQREAIVELEMGTPLSYLIYDVAGGFAPDRAFKAAFSGVSNRPVTAAHIDVPMDFESLKAAGAGIGSAGFMAYDDSTCIAEVGAVLSKFLYDGSCGQCPSCKLGTEILAGMFADLAAGTARAGTLEDMDAWLVKITESNRCGLPGGQQALADGILSYFRDDLYARLDGTPCPNPGHVRLPKFVDYLPAEGRFVYWDEVYG
jgi:NADH-quinone oxidoreductase subunit F